MGERQEPTKTGLTLTSCKKIVKRETETPTGMVTNVAAGLDEM